jgi:hypothetical protein
MSQETTYAGLRGEWQGLNAPLAEHPPGLEHIEPFRLKLVTVLDRSLEITKEQTGLAAQKQELSKELRQVMADGRRVAALLKKALQQHLGPSSEQLTAFQVQPFRGRKARKKKENKEPGPVASGSASPAI